jgi:hypothetical protein
MHPEQNEAMQPDRNQALKDLIEGILLRRESLLAELGHLNNLLAIYQNEPSKAESKSMPQLKLQSKPKPPRVRGVLAAARKAIEQLPSPFDKNQLLAKLVEINEEFADKKVTGANIRNALRLLTQEGVIKVESEASATTCARYVKVNVKRA